MTKSFVKGIPARFKGYVRVNWGAPFIVGFMLLLMVAAASLSIGLDVVANEVAIYAYYAIVVGVVLQLVCFLKYNKRNGEKINESS
jgi:heme/copper-type cytochrome/quinol oxidase subunit 4